MRSFILVVFLGFFFSQSTFARGGAEGGGSSTYTLNAQKSYQEAYVHGMAVSKIMNKELSYQGREFAIQNCDDPRSLSKKKLIILPEKLRIHPAVDLKSGRELFSAEIEFRYECKNVFQ